jgi:predicted PP-loop superfamily ATPase
MDSELESTIEQVLRLQDELEQLKVEFALLEMRMNASENPPRRKVNWFVIGVALYGGVLAWILLNSQQGLALPWAVTMWFWCACMIALFVAKRL